MLCGVVTGVVVYGLAEEWAVGVAAVALMMLAAWRGMRVATGLLAGLALGWMSAALNSVELPDRFPDDKERITGRIRSVKEVATGRGMVMDTDAGRVMLTVPGLLPEVEPDDVVSVTGRWSPAVYPVDLPGEYDGRATARSERLSMRCYVAHDSLIVLGRYPSLEGLMWRWRARVVSLVMSSGLDDGAGQMVTAILTGEGDVVADGRRERFAAAGVAHILALSGAHVAILSMIAGWMLLPLSLMRLRKWRWGVTIVLLWLFALFTGMPVSVVRSVIMASVIMTGMMLERPRSGINGWCLAGIVILLFRPWELWSAGFQLSFLATLAILVTYPLLGRLPIRNVVARWFVMTVGVTLAATIATGFVSAWHFHQFPLTFIVANIVVVALMPLLITGGIVVLVCASLGFSGGWAAEGVNFIYGIIESVVDGMAGIGGVVIGIYIPLWLVIAMTVAVLVCLFATEARRMAVAFGALLVMAWGVGVIAVGAPYAQGEELWVTRDKDCCQMVVRRGGRVDVVRVSPVPVSPGDSLDIVRRYDCYLRENGVKALSVGNDPRMVTDSLGLLQIAGKRLAFVGGETMEVPGRLDYIIVTQSYRDSVVWLARLGVADHILMGSDVRKIRARRLVRELREAGVESWWLGDSVLHLSSQ